MRNVYIYNIEDLGEVLIEENGEAITKIKYCMEHPQISIIKETDLIRATSQQLIEYMKGERKEFTLPLAPNGSAFQQLVWKTLCTIPYGETRSYSQLAQMIGNGKACRAVGGANNTNPILILIPCHRVIGKDGSMVGYAAGLQLKEKLLNLESLSQKAACS